MNRVAPRGYQQTMVARTGIGDRQIRMLNRDQWMGLVDRAARRELGMSGDEFIRRWEAGEFRDPDERPEVMRVAMLLPGGW